MKVRIGNDIRLKIRLKLGDIDLGVWGFGDKLPATFDNQSIVSTSVEYANIQFAQAFFVNTTLKNKLEEEYKKKNRFIGRFPIEPFVDEFQPSAYNIHSTGYPRYRAAVFNEYKGFGINPNWKEAFPIKDIRLTKYSAAVERTTDPRTIIVTFPAEAQLEEGEYELIVVAKIYAPGYSNNVRTITVDYKKIFELVGSTADADVEGATQIEINNQNDLEDLPDVYAISGSYDDGAIKVKRNDGGVIDIDVSPITGWYEGA